MEPTRTECMRCEFFDRGDVCSSPTMTTGEATRVQDRVLNANRILQRMLEAGFPEEAYKGDTTGSELKWMAMVGGACPGYRPSLWTRLLRKIGMRKPVMR